MKRFLHEPLFVFLLVGVVLFWLLTTWTSPTVRHVEVDRNSLLTFIKQRTNDFSPGSAEKRLEQATPAEIRALIQQHVREEVLYREALVLGLDRSDYVLKRRLAQKSEQLAKGFAISQEQPSARAVQEFFADNIERYRIEASLTFTHVYFSSGPDSLANATAMLGELNRAQIDAAHANQHGQRFPYHLNYVDRNPEFVQSHFGEHFTGEIGSLNIDTVQWQGPIASKFGHHLILLIENEPSRLADLSEVIDRVTIDVRQATVQQTSNTSVQQIIDSYDIQRSAELEKLVLP